MMSSQAVFIKVQNTLMPRARRGRGLTVEEMQKAAGEVVEGHKTKFRDELLEAIAGSRAAIDAWRPGRGLAGLVSELFAMAAKAEEHGAIFGNRLLSEVGVKLTKLTSRFSSAAAASTPSDKAMTSIRLHLDAMTVALDRAQADTIDEAGQRLLNNLELTHRTIK